MKIVGEGFVINRATPSTFFNSMQNITTGLLTNISTVTPCPSRKETPGHAERIGEAHLLYVFNIPGVAGAVLQAPLLLIS